MKLTIYLDVQTKRLVGFFWDSAKNREFFTAHDETIGFGHE